MCQLAVLLRVDRAYPYLIHSSAALAGGFALNAMTRAVDELPQPRVPARWN